MTDTSQYLAFDYDEQEWVYGTDAIHLLLQQARETEHILHGDRAEEYVRLSNCPYSADEALARTEARINELKAALASSR